jgi:hypothetical protein
MAHRVTAQNLEFLLTGGNVAVAAVTCQINCGSNVSGTLPNWNNDADIAATTISNLKQSDGTTTSYGYTNEAYDSVQSDGIAHADLPAAVSASYLKWYASPRTVTLTGLDNGRTHTITFYSTAPGSVTVNWTCNGNIQALARGGKVSWFSVYPTAGVITIVSANTTSGSDATLSAVILTLEAVTESPNISARVSSQAYEALIGTYDAKIAKAYATAVLTSTGDKEAISKAYATVVLGDDSMATTESYGANVVLLCHFDGTAGQTTTVDSSQSAHPLTMTTQTLSTTQTKFGTTALSTAAGNTAVSTGLADFQLGSQPFTIEAHVFLTTTTSGTYVIVGNFASTTNLGWNFSVTSGQLYLTYTQDGINSGIVGSTFNYSANRWYHVAVDRDHLGVFRVYNNGVVLSTSSASNFSLYPSTRTLYIGNDGNLNRNFPGYIDDLRITRGVARYAGTFFPLQVTMPDPAARPTSDPDYANVVLLLHGNGTNASTTIIDSSTSAKTVTPNGNAQISTAQSQFGGACLLFDGTGDFLTVPTGTDWQFPGPFTLEGWFRWSTTLSTSREYHLLSYYSIATGTLKSWNLVLWYTGGVWTLRFNWSTDNSTIVSLDYPFQPTTATTAWYHIAVDRDASNVVRIYINGTPVASATRTGTNAAIAEPLRVGATGGLTAGNEWQGNIDDLRITKGVARYAGTTFATPLAAYYDYAIAPVIRRPPVIALCG